MKKGMSWFKKCQGAEPTALSGNVKVECYDRSECVDFETICDHELHCSDGSDEDMCNEENLLNLIHGISPAIANAESQTVDAVQQSAESEAAYANAGCVVMAEPFGSGDGGADSKSQPKTAEPLSLLCLRLQAAVDRTALAVDRATNHETFAKAAFKVAWRLLAQFEEGPSTTTMTTTTTTLYVLPAVVKKKPIHTGTLLAVLLALGLSVLIGYFVFKADRKRRQEEHTEAYRINSARGVENPLYAAPAAMASVPGAGLDGNYLTVGSTEEGGGGDADADGGVESGMESDEA